MRLKDLPEVFEILRAEYKTFQTPAVTVVSETTRDPFKVLVSCILSLRTQDKTTADASARLFKAAPNAVQLSKLKVERIEELIYPVGFYKNKAVQIKEISRRIIEEFSGRVPETIDALLGFKGVGRKTANLVVTFAYGRPGICVDIHVHRITNRWGFVETKSPDKTEQALREKLPPEYWIPINDLLVAYGQNLCKPISPFCSRCALRRFCKRVGVDKSR